MPYKWNESKKVKDPVRPHVAAGEILEYLPELPPHAAYDIGCQKQWRRECWQQTEKICATRGGYVAPGDTTGTLIPISFAASVAGAKKVGGDVGARSMWPKKPTFKDPAVIEVVHGDCVDVTAALTMSGYNPMMMDAASRKHFGGGYKGGSRAQEEELCRRTTLAFACDVSLGYQRNNLYPMEPTDSVYVPDVTIFRHGASKCYSCMSTPAKCGVGAVAAHNKPPLVEGGMAMEHSFAQETEDMIRTFFHVGCTNGHDAVVCVPLGCGAFQNPAAHVSALMAKVVNEYRFSYKKIVVSIIEDHNSRRANPTGNFLPFAMTLATQCGATAMDAMGAPITVEELAELEAEGGLQAATGDGPKEPRKRKGKGAPNHEVIDVDAE